METQIRIPEGAVGHVGLLASLKQIKGLPAGRLCIVRYPVGWVRELLGATRPVFTWEVFLTGEPVLIQGRPFQQIVVADGCLTPMSELPPDEAERIVGDWRTAQDQAAVEALRDRVGSAGLSDAEFKTAFDRATVGAFPEETNEKAGVVSVLLEIGFTVSPGGYQNAYEWRMAHAGIETAMHAGHDLFGNWRLWAFAHTEREHHCPETVILNDWPRGRVIEAVLHVWEDIYGTADVPWALRLGWHYRLYQKEKKLFDARPELLIPQPSPRPLPPGAEVDGAGLRRALRWLREAYPSPPDFEGWPPRETLRLEVRDGLLRLITREHDLGVACLSGQIDAAEVGLHEFLAVVPRRLRRQSVAIVDTGAEIWVAEVSMPKIARCRATPGN